MADHFSLRTYALFILALLAAMLLCVCVGSVSVAPKDTLTAIFCALLGKPAPAGVAKNIIVNVRLPRVMNVALVGASLSLCGAAMQGLLRNPLADGSTLGVSAGASLGAVIALALGVTIPGSDYGGTMLMAMAFAFLSLTLILSLAYALDHSLATNSIILIGVIFSMFVSSVINLILSFVNDQVRSIAFWTMGSLSGTGYPHTRILSLALLLCGGVIAVVLLIVGIRSGARLVDIKQTLDRGDGVFYPNIYVNDIPLQGKTLDEAAALVTQQVQSLISSFKITLRTQDGRSWDITGDSLNMQYNVADQLDQLWAIGHTGSSSVRYEQVKALEEEPAMRYTTLSYDMSQVNQILSQIKSEVDLPAVNATRVDDETKWPPFSYTDETAGQTLDITGLNERICTMVNMLESGVVDLTPVPVQPSVTRAQLEAQIVKLSSFETTVGKTGDYVESRTENIRVGTERFNRLTVAPGKSVSFNKVALKRTAANGYQAALEIAYGNYVEGIGGGICQVSSTLYNAVVNAGLTVNKRTPHAIPSSYVDKGKDATVSDDRYDFVFTNNTGANIYIETQFVKVKGYWTSRFIIYGRPDPNGYTYKLDSQVVETIPLPEPTYEKDKTGEHVIYDDETQIKYKGREGYVVDVYLVTMDSNGLEISREKKYTDTYKAAAPIYYVGVTPRETPLPDTPSID